MIFIKAENDMRPEHLKDHLLPYYLVHQLCSFEALLGGTLVSTSAGGDTGHNLFSCYLQTLKLPMLGGPLGLLGQCFSV